MLRSSESRLVIALFALVIVLLLGSQADAQQFLYVANNGSSSVSGFKIAPSGSLTAVSGSPFPTGSSPTGVATDPFGRFVYVCNFGDVTISGYTIDPARGTLTTIPGSPFQAGGVRCNGAAVDPAGKFLYVANQIDAGPGEVSGLSIDQSSGALTLVAGSPFTTGGSQTVAVTVDPTHNFVYAADIFSSDVAVFSKDPNTGVLSAVPGSPFPTGTIHFSDPSSVVVTPTSRFLYTGDYDFSGVSGDVTAFSINSGTGFLTQLVGSPFPTGGNNSNGAAMDPAGRFLFVANQSTQNVSGFTVDSDGSLAAVPGSPFGTAGTALYVAVDHSGTFAYVTNEEGSVSAYSINSSTGALTQLPGSPFAVAGAWGIAVAQANGGAALKPAKLAFGTQLIGTTSPLKTATLTNTGSQMLDISNIETAGEFEESNTCPSSLAPGASCAIDVVFKPTAKGLQNSQLSVSDSAPNSPQTVALSGTGTYVQLTPAKLNFGSVMVGKSSPPKNATLTNTAATSLTLTSITITGTNSSDFSQSSTCGSSVAAGASCTITVIFTPTATGTRSAQVSISDNGGGSPQKVSLAGTGT